MIAPEHERVQPPAGEGFSDSVSFSFADPEAELYGLARIGLAPQDGQASVLAVLFWGREPVAARAQGAIEVGEAGWDELEVGGLVTRTAEPLSAWRTEWEGDGAGFALDFSALCDPLELGAQTAAGQASGVEGYEQVCRVEGEVWAGGRRTAVGCLGQRGHGWGAAPWRRIELARTVSAWIDDGPRAVALSAVRPAGAEAHGDEAVTAFLVEPADGRPEVAAVAEPRLSTTYDGEGRQRRAGVELWLDEEDEMPRRISGRVACGTSLALGRLRLECAFFRWSMEGREGAGRYDVLRRA